ncbi:MAG TPA: tRNA (adenosine(37)-N6)-threonylcarbamoyltransferase complex transferase subunit TsaD [Solirubrobacteraceae bacterium]|jgi:N6-L-threonylcarbamoyladenine synthase|nr:tRNA (adenosine(37)-N6)-threonylcarbamoyltransferase complex transferase subunit TsaD [Solirubrobacteraceae bacterium]
MTVLAVETSCDDTCVAVVGEDGSIRSNVISSQRAHDRFGGVVPEIASRHHLELIDVVVERALQEADVKLDEIDLVAATQGPGLIGALLVGFSAAKGIAAARELPFAAVDHIQGHVAANFLLGESTAIEPPFLCLIASGGHTLLAHVREHHGFEQIGRTLDDAAGEAFDKGARMLGLGYPGGPALERLAAEGDPQAFEFPASGSRSRGGRGATSDFARSLDFSFAGLKTSLLYRTRELGEDALPACAPDLAASYQAAIVDHLLLRCEQALERTGLDRLAVGGGVAANSELRRRLKSLGVELHVPPMALCTDNAAMIGSAARYAPRIAYPAYLGLDAYATGERPGSR